MIYFYLQNLPMAVKQTIGHGVPYIYHFASISLYYLFPGLLVSILLYENCITRKTNSSIWTTSTCTTPFYVGGRQGGRNLGVKGWEAYGRQENR